MIVQNPKYPNLISVRAVKPGEGLVVHVTFSDGTQRDIDLDPLIGSGPMFAPIRRDPSFFRQVHVDPETQTLTWPNGADIAPETLYYEGQPPWAALEVSSSRQRPRRRPSPNKRKTTHKSRTKA